MSSRKASSRSLGLAALYLAAALVAAMLYFLIGTGYPTVTDPVEKVDLLVQNQFGLHVAYLVSYVAFGLVLAGLAVGLMSRMSSPTGRVAAAIGLLWAAMLVASGMVFIVGMDTVVTLNATDPAASVTAWQSIEPVASGLGGAGGEVLGGTWVLLVSAVALRLHTLPRWLTWLGVIVGIAGIASTLPGLAGATIGFGLLVIVWLTGLGVTLLRERPAVRSISQTALVGAR